LALLNAEPGADKVRLLLPGAAISAVNVAEVLAKLVTQGMPAEEALEALEELDLPIVAFGAEEALVSVRYVHPSLSLGDRACLATAEARNEPAVTADRVWKRTWPSAKIEVIR
jgi:PIN domain nuclease of toxin-antitoxin system